MLQPLLNHLKTSILTLNPNTFQNGYAGARQYQDGKIVIFDNSEGTYVGLSDNFGNYFYIRYRDEIDIDIPTANRSSSCEELTGLAPLRLVAWVRSANLQKLCDVLLHDILATDFNDMSDADKEMFSDALFEYNNIELDPEQIFKDETGKEDEAVRQEKGVTLIAIDFGIRFNYKLKNESCIDRNICVGCSE